MKKLSKEEVELGTVTALMERAAHRRIPRLLRIKKAVDNGDRLTDYQINFLSKVFSDAQRAVPYYDEHPELQELFTKVVSLYGHITEQAIINEESNLKAKAPPLDI
jgi:hypothetical protein